MTSYLFRCIDKGSWYQLPPNDSLIIIHINFEFVLCVVWPHPQSCFEMPNHTTLRAGRGKPMETQLHKIINLHINTALCFDTTFGLHHCIVCWSVTEYYRDYSINNCNKLFSSSLIINGITVVSIHLAYVQYKILYSLAHPFSLNLTD